MLTKTFVEIIDAAHELLADQQRIAARILHDDRFLLRIDAHLSKRARGEVFRGGDAVGPRRRLTGSVDQQWADRRQTRVFIQPVGQPRHRVRKHFDPRREEEQQLRFGRSGSNVHRPGRPKMLGQTKNLHARVLGIEARPFVFAAAIDDDDLDTLVTGRFFQRLNRAPQLRGLVVGHQDRGHPRTLGLFRVWRGFGLRGSHQRLLRSGRELLSLRRTSFSFNGH